jgi:hypothetical protein
MSEKAKNVVSLCLLVLAVLASVFLVLRRASAKGPDPAPLPPITPTPRVVVEEREVETVVEKVVEVEKKISVEEVESGLRDMGLLITGEYWFTSVTGASEIASVFGLDLGFTESSFLASYDGVVAAGVDFGAITLSKIDSMRTVTVRLPKAEILYVDIDPESFRLISEKNSIFTDLSAVDFNDSVAALEKEAREKAAERGLLERSDENAQKLVTNFIAGLLGSNWRVVFEPRA